MTYRLLIVLLVVFTATPVLAVLPEIFPAGFPWLAGNCGLGLPRSLSEGFALGVNCGLTATQNVGFGCDPVPGGHNCHETFQSYASASRWVTAGTMTGSIDGSCNNAKQASWAVGGALIAVDVYPSCTASVFVPSGGCAFFHFHKLATFTGDFAPAPYDGGTATAGLCP